MKLIDADRITYESIDSSDTGRYWQYHGTGIIAVRKKDIDKMPSIQLEIIRCKDCKYYRNGICKEEGVCVKACVNKSPNGFCDWGERREVTE